MAARLAPAGAPKKYTGGLQVMSSGLGRTGTSSLKKALELLYKDGGGKCYHMTEVIEGGGAFGHFDFWVSAAKVRGAPAWRCRTRAGARLALRT
jgi:hypothetical protein